MELNYNKDLFKSLLGTMQKHYPECKDLQADTVVLFNSKFSTASKEQIGDTVPYYNELSSGEFEIDLDDELLIEKFEKTKTLIINNLNRSII